MMNLKFLFIQCCIVLFVCMLLPAVSAVGIAGDITSSFDFQPGLEKSFSYGIIVNSGTVMDYEVRVKEDLAPYITIDRTHFEDVFPGTIPGFTATLRLPDTLPAGEHTAFVCALEVQTRGGGDVGARTEACGSIVVRVLYGEKYLKLERFDVPNVDIGDRIKMELTIKSWSQVDISKLQASIDIYGRNPQGELSKITTISTEEKPLPSNARETLTAYLDTAGYEAGEYIANATLYYDEKELNTLALFRVGTFNVKILNYTSKFEQGKVNRFGISAMSQWNSFIDGAYAVVEIDKENLTTPVSGLKPWENITFMTFWDTSSKRVGMYEGKITVYYANKTTEEQIAVQVTPNREMIRFIIAIIIIVLIMVSIALVIIIKMRKDNSSHGKTKK